MDQYDLLHHHYWYQHLSSLISKLSVFLCQNTCKTIYVDLTQQPWRVHTSLDTHGWCNSSLQPGLKQISKFVLGEILVQNGYVHLKEINVYGESFEVIFHTEVWTFLCVHYVSD